MKSKIEIRNDENGCTFLRATCEDGTRDITPSGPVTEHYQAMFEADLACVGSYGATTDWYGAEVTDLR